jgi:hypothetical protein
MPDAVQLSQNLLVTETPGAAPSQNSLTTDNADPSAFSALLPLQLAQLLGTGLPVPAAIPDSTNGNRLPEESDASTDELSAVNEMALWIGPLAESGAKTFVAAASGQDAPSSGSTISDDAPGIVATDAMMISTAAPEGSEPEPNGLSAAKLPSPFPAGAAAGGATELPTGFPGGAALTNSSGQTLAPPARAEPHLSASVSLPLEHHRWGEALASRVVWQIGERLQQAHIHVNPPELGPIDVQVQVQDGQASVHFQTGHSSVKDAIQEALPRLREMLAQTGLQLADSQVSQGHSGTGRESSRLSIWEEGDRLGHTDPLREPEMTAVREGLIDAYA